VFKDSYIQVYLREDAFLLELIAELGDLFSVSRDSDTVSSIVASSNHAFRSLGLHFFPGQSHSGHGSLDLLVLHDGHSSVVGQAHGLFASDASIRIAAAHFTSRVTDDTV
jgi:hypothetical protein